jgi:hypothetical protein
LPQASEADFGEQPARLDSAFRLHATIDHPRAAGEHHRSKAQRLALSEHLLGQLCRTAVESR